MGFFSGWVFWFCFFLREALGAAVLWKVARGNRSAGGSPNPGSDGADLGLRAAEEESDTERL